MRKVLFFMFLLFLIGLGTANLNAQVSIGADQEPNKFSLLDLVSTSIKKGIHLPRLTTVERDALVSAASAAGDKTDAKGLAIFNTTTNCYDVWNGTQWLSLCDFADVAPVITVQPRAFNWKEVVGAGNMEGIGGSLPTISITATGSGLTYQWYEIPKNSNAAPVLVAGATAAAYTPVLTALGMRSYYCVVSNASGSIQSDVAKVAVGCGAFATDGTWRTFMCYNLGATQTTISGQLSYANNLYLSGALGTTPATAAQGDSAVFGNLYQWGRIADGHQKRNSLNSVVNGPAPGTYTDFDGAWAAGGSEQVRSDSVRFYGRFITNPSTPYNWNRNPSGRNVWLWRTYRYTNNDPCGQVSGANWRMPTQTEWGDIFRGGQGSGAPGTANANTWVWRAPGTTTNLAYGTAGGYEIKPDGVTTTLFLPAAGSRNDSNGQLYSSGVNGNYWSATTYGEFSFYLRINSSLVRPAYYYSLANGFSVRCVAEL